MKPQKILHFPLFSPTDRNEAAILGYIQAESLIPRKRIAVNMIHKRHNDPDYYALSKNSILLELGERRRVTPRSSSGATPMVPSLNMLYRLELTTAVENPRGSIFTADTASPILFTHGEEQDGAVDALSALYRTRFQEPYGS